MGAGAGRCFFYLVQLRRTMRLYFFLEEAGVLLRRLSGYSCGFYI